MTRKQMEKVVAAIRKEIGARSGNIDLSLSAFLLQPRDIPTLWGALPLGWKVTMPSHGADTFTITRP